MHIHWHQAFFVQFQRVEFWRNTTLFYWRDIFQILVVVESKEATFIGRRVEVREVESRVSTNLEIHIHSTHVFHTPLHGNLVAVEQITNHQTERERELAERVRCAFQPIHDAIVFLVSHLEIHVAGKTMLAELVLLSDNTIAFFPYASDNREKDRQGLGLQLPAALCRKLPEFQQLDFEGRRN